MFTTTTIILNRFLYCLYSLQTLLYHYDRNLEKALVIKFTYISLNLMHPVNNDVI